MQLGDCDYDRRKGGEVWAYFPSPGGLSGFRPNPLKESPFPEKKTQCVRDGEIMAYI